jgi:ABC-type sugar transport system ATPase subunit
MIVPPAVRFDSVTRRFPGVLAVESVSFEVAAGSCHAICGENGAGKSTLGKLLAGIHRLDGGRIFLHGEEVAFAGPAAARRMGVGMVHQELAFAENLTVAENLCLGDLPGRLGWVAFGEMRKRARGMLASIDARIDERRLAGELTVGEQQLCQIAGAVGSGARVLVFDEPSSSLPRGEAERLFELIGRLREQGVTILYVSHRLPEIYRLCDTITVLRDGGHVTTRPAGELDETALVQAMIGRPLTPYAPRSVQRPPGDVRLEVKELTSPGRFAQISLELRAGEIVGMAGLIGAGRSELVQALFGLDPEVSGQVNVEGRPGTPTSPAAAMALGLGLVPEDRKRQGLVLSLSAGANLTLPILHGPRTSRLGFIRRKEEEAVALELFRTLRVRAPGTAFVAAGLSGGNQQKLVLGKWLAARCRVLLLDEPTRGVDVGGKAEIHGIIDALAVEGTAVLLISSELPELIKLSHRILVLRQGRLVGQLGREEASEEAVMRLMGGVTSGVSAGAESKAGTRTGTKTGGVGPP